MFWVLLILENRPTVGKPQGLPLQESAQCRAGPVPAQNTLGMKMGFNLSNADRT